MVSKTLFAPLFLITLVMTALLSGCASMTFPLSEDQVNAKLFASPDDLVSRVSHLHVGMTKEESFTVLGISEKTPNIERLDAPTLRNIIYGNEIRVMSYADTELFKNRLTKQSGYKVPFVFKKQSGAITTPAHFRFLYQGYDLTTVILFDEGKLIDVRITGIAKIDTQEKRFILSVVGPKLFK